jgi:hypothetical protein
VALLLVHVSVANAGGVIEIGEATSVTEGWTAGVGVGVGVGPGVGVGVGEGTTVPEETPAHPTINVPNVAKSRIDSRQ